MDKLNILHIADLHLYDEEIGNTLGYPDECIANLKNIKEVFENGDYDMVTLGGDIQHARIKSEKYRSIFMLILRDIGSLAYQRMLDKGILSELKVYDLQGDLMDLSDYREIIFTVRGQHDNNSIDKYTFFDTMLDHKILINPRSLQLGSFQFNFINYSKVFDDFFVPRRDHTNLMFNMYHFPILERGVLGTELEKSALSPTDTKIFKDVDVALINDIHMYIEPYKVATGDSSTLVITPGSVGRTSDSDSHARDFANLLDLKVDLTTNDFDISFIELELKPYDDFFNNELAIVKKLANNAFENFRIEISNVDIDYFEPVAQIQSMTEVPEKIRTIAVSILQGQFERAE